MNTTELSEGSRLRQRRWTVFCNLVPKALFCREWKRPGDEVVYFDQGQRQSSNAFPHPHPVPCTQSWLTHCPWFIALLKLAVNGNVTSKLGFHYVNFYWESTTFITHHAFSFTFDVDLTAALLVWSRNAPPQETLRVRKKHKRTRKGHYRLLQDKSRTSKRDMFTSLYR